MVGRAVHGEATDAFRQWYGRMSKQLGHQPPQRIINELRLLQRQHPEHPEAETIEVAIGYLEKRLSMIDYPFFVAGRFPLGQDMSKAATKLSCSSG